MAEQLLEIGKPCKFHEKVDPQDRHSNYIKSKMNIVDIVPCTCNISISQLHDILKTGKIKSNLLPKLDYETGISLYKQLQKAYNLDPYIGLRLYLTDETTATDSFNNQFQDNFFQGALNQLSSYAKTVYQAGRSVMGEAYETKMKELTQQGANMLHGLISSKVDKDMQKFINGSIDTLQSIANTVLKGNKIPLPKIWSQSNYTPSFNAVIKLVSPYGHPRGIAEYVIRPLLYLLLMAAPQTNDGISYGLSQTFTLRAYGITQLKLACISDITLRRGGNDTSFNIYRQPLSIDVSVQFQTIVDGFGAFTDKNPLERNVLSDINSFIYADKQENILAQNNSALFQTVGSVMESLRPVYLQDHSVDAKTLSMNGDISPPSNKTTHTSYASLGSEIEGVNTGNVLTNFFFDNIAASEQSTLSTNISDVSQDIYNSKTSINENQFV